jgi:hypothetical protein
MLEERLGAVDSAAATSGNLYSGRRASAAAEAGGAVQNQFYNNYMNLLQNMANPESTTNLSSLGMNQGLQMGQQNIAATNAANDYNLQGARADSAARADFIGGLGSAYNNYQNTQQSQGRQAGNTYDNYLFDDI